jgi:disulfide bond formation protein DsbB
MNEVASPSIEGFPRRGQAMWNLAALALAAVAAVGSVYLSVGLKLKACPLCFYQRSFAIACVLTLLILLWLDGWRTPRACLV